MDIKRGREIFFDCFGNHMIISQEYGDEYDKCRVSKEYEHKWNQEIKLILKAKIDESIGLNRLDYVDRYIELLNEKDAIDYLLSFLREKEIDSFSSLILLETCKTKILSYYHNNEKQEYLKDIELLKNKCLSKPIDIDSSYLRKKDYSITIEEIKNRYRKL